MSRRAYNRFVEAPVDLCIQGKKSKKFVPWTNMTRAFAPVAALSCLQGVLDGLAINNPPH